MCFVLFFFLLTILLFTNKLKLAGNFSVPFMVQLGPLLYRQFLLLHRYLQSNAHNKL